MSIARIARLIRTPTILACKESEPSEDGHFESGFTILELLAAMAILGIMSASILALLISATRLQSRASARTIAALIAERTLEEARSAGVFTLKHIIDEWGGRYELTPPIQEGPFTFYRRIDVAWEAVSGTANPARADIIRVTAEVRWDNMEPDLPVVKTTYVAGEPCPTNAGFVKVNVVDHAFQGVPNVVLDMRTRTGLSWGTSYTDSSGQAIFVCVFADSYEITGTRSGYIAKDLSKKVIVPNIILAPGEVKTVEFQLAKKAKAKIRLLDAVSGRELTGTAAVSLSTSSFRTVQTGNSPFTFDPLWPDTYSIAAAVYECAGGGFMSAVVADEQRLLDPGNNDIDLNLSPGSNTTVEVTVLDGNDAAVQGASVLVRDACGTLYNFPVTDPSGTSQRSGLLPGLYEITVTPPPPYRITASQFIASSDPTRVTIKVS